MKRKIVYGIFAATLIGTAALTVTPSTAQAATTTGWVKESGKWYFYKDGAKAIANEVARMITASH